LRCAIISFGEEHKAEVLGVNSFKNALLASSVLTTVGFGASATTFVEDMTSPIIIDFSNTPAGANPIDFSMFQSVQGTLSGSADPADYFTFTGLTAGDDFSITFNRLTGFRAFTFTADGFSETLLGGRARRTPACSAPRC
jgi:hypothetical protein